MSLQNTMLGEPRPPSRARRVLVCIALLVGAAFLLVKVESYYQRHQAISAITRYRPQCQELAGKLRRLRGNWPFPNSATTAPAAVGESFTRTVSPPLVFGASSNVLEIRFEDTGELDAYIWTSFPVRVALSAASSLDHPVIRSYLSGSPRLDTVEEGLKSVVTARYVLVYRLREVHLPDKAPPPGAESTVNPPRATAQVCLFDLQSQALLGNIEVDVRPSVVFINWSRVLNDTAADDANFRQGCLEALLDQASRSVRSRVMGGS